MSTTTDALKAGATGAGAGAAFGPWGALIGGLIGAGGSIAGSLLGGKDKETPMQAKQQELIDQLLASLGGSGPFADLFSPNEAAFQKSFVDPAKSLFSNQIAPQIQQQYIASGQQRGTGLDDTLARAGVDLDQMLNQQYMQFLQQGQQNKLGGIGAILGAAPGAAAPTSFGQDFASATGGYLTSKAFPETLKNIREGFTNDK